MLWRRAKSLLFTNTSVPIADAYAIFAKSTVTERGPVR